MCSELRSHVAYNLGPLSVRCFITCKHIVFTCIEIERLVACLRKPLGFDERCAFDDTCHMRIGTSGDVFNLPVYEARPFNEDKVPRPHLTTEGAFTNLRLKVEVFDFVDKRLHRGRIRYFIRLKLTCNVCEVNRGLS